MEYILVQLLNSLEAVRGAARGELSAYQENLLRTLEASEAQGRRVAEPLRWGSGETDFNVWGLAYDVLEGDGRIVSPA